MVRLGQLRVDANGLFIHGLKHWSVSEPEQPGLGEVGVFRPHRCIFKKAPTFRHFTIHDMGAPSPRPPPKRRHQISRTALVKIHEEIMGMLTFLLQYRAVDIPIHSIAAINTPSLVSKFVSKLVMQPTPIYECYARRELGRRQPISKGKITQGPVSLFITPFHPRPNLFSQDPARFKRLTNPLLSYRSNREAWVRH